MYAIWHVFLLWTLYYYYCYSWWYEHDSLHTIYRKFCAYSHHTVISLVFTIYEMPANLVTTLLFHCNLQDVLIDVRCWNPPSAI